MNLLSRIKSIFMTPQTITEEMLVAHPEYTQAGLTVGDAVPVEGTIIGEEDFTVSEEFMTLNPEYDGKIGDVIKRPILAGHVVEAPAVDEVKADEVTTETISEEAVAETVAEVVDETPKKYYEGKVIIAETPNEHEGLKTTKITIEDGSSYLVTDAEYEIKVKTI